MTEEIKTCNNNQKMSVYCKTCVCKSCEQVARLEQENKELHSVLEEIKNNFMCFRSCITPFHVGEKDNLPHKMADVIQNYCESIINKINEVLE